jgi:UDP-N-acetyl-2-amino-2-deoxyglucuronate dehydrogenase
MVREFDRMRLCLFTVKQNRTNPTILKLKSAIDNNQFGAIRLVVTNVFWTRPQSYYEQNNGWRGTWEMDGGAVFNQASHYIDLLRWLVGSVRSTSVTSTTARDIQTEDTFTATLNWQRGAIGSLNVTMLTYPQNLEGSITVIGDRGTARVGGYALNEIQEWTFEDADFEKSTTEDVNYLIDDVYGNGHGSYYKELDKYLREGHGEVSDARDAIQTVELLCAMQRSARDGYPCHLPLEL